MSLMTSTLPRIALLISLCTVSVIGCDNKEDTAAKKEDSFQAASGTTKASSAAVGEAMIDPKLRYEIIRVADHCLVVPDSTTIRDCKSREAKRLFKTFYDGERDRIDSLDTLSKTLTSDKPNVHQVAVVLADKIFDTFPGANVGDVRPDVARRLIDATATLDRYDSTRVIPMTTHAALLTGDEATVADLIEMTREHANETLHARATEHLLQYQTDAGLKPLMSALTSDDQKLRAAAARAVARAKTLSDTARAEICPWGKEHITETATATRALAGDILSACGGDMHDVLLSAMEKHQADGTFAREDASILRTLCAPTSDDTKPGDEVCARDVAILADVVTNTDLPSAVRGEALLAIAYQKRDADSLALLKKWKEEGDDTIQEYAAEGLKIMRTAAVQ